MVPFGGALVRRGGGVVTVVMCTIAALFLLGVGDVYCSCLQWCDVVRYFICYGGEV